MCQILNHWHMLLWHIYYVMWSVALRSITREESKVSKQYNCCYESGEWLHRNDGICCFQRIFSLSLLQRQGIQGKQRFRFRKKNSFLNGRNALSYRDCSLFNQLTLYSLSIFLHKGVQVKVFQPYPLCIEHIAKNNLNLVHI